MKPSIKLVVIGVGEVAEYLLAGYHALVGADLQNSVIGTTADVGQAEQKSRDLGFPVQYKDNAGALKKGQPDIIVFAPPPTVTEELIETVLKPYYAALRKEGAPLPDVYALPPRPFAKAYREVLGEDVHVVNIIPNMFRTASGEVIAEHGYSLLSFDPEDVWPEEQKERLLHFLAPYGTQRVALPKEHLTVLAGTIALYTAVDAVHAITEVLEKAGVDTGGAVGAWLGEKGATAKGPDLQAALSAVYSGMYDGSVRALAELGIPKEEAERDQGQNLRQQCLVAEKEEPVVAVHNTMRHATPGGVTERAEIFFQREISPLLIEAFSDISGIEKEKLYHQVEAGYYYMVKDVAEHGQRLNEAPVPNDNTIEQHAVVLALLAKYAIQYAGEAGKEAYLAGITRVGIERGTRMAARAILRGDRLDYVNYVAYGEWRAQEGEMDFATVGTLPEAVTEGRKCAWNDTWRKYDLLEYGKYYCVNVDDAIFRGFHPDFRCDIRANLSWEAPACIFHWGQTLTEEDEKRLVEKRKELGDSCIKPFNYHIGHVLHSVGDELERMLGEPGRLALLRTKYEFTKLFGREYMLAVEGIYPGDGVL